MLWLIFALLTAAAVISVLWPLAKTPRGVGRGAIGVALYKAQLAEIERDEAQSLVAPEDAKGAKAEAARRLMAAAEAPVEPTQVASPKRVLASLHCCLDFCPSAGDFALCKDWPSGVARCTASGAAQRDARPHGLGRGDREDRSASCAASR